MPATVNTTGRSQHISPSAPLSAPILALRPTLVPHVYYYCHCDGDKPCPETIVIALIFGKSGALPPAFVLCSYYYCYCDGDNLCPETIVTPLVFGTSGALPPTLVLYVYYYRHYGDVNLCP